LGGTKLLEKVTLGNTGIEVSKICFGGLTVGPLQANLPLEEGSEVLAYGFERGISFIDTAQLYETYPYIKRAMEISGKYDTVVSTKTYAYTRELAKEAVDQARRELNRDYIDIFMLHEQEDIWTLRGHMEAIEYMMECKQKGIIRAVGSSMHHIAAVKGATEIGLDVIHPLINKNGLGIADGTREEMEEAIRAAKKAGIGVFTMKPLGGGNLFKEAESCLQYILNADFADAFAIGMQCKEEVDANIYFVEHGHFSEKDKERIQGRTRRLLIDDWCEGCGSCARRCPQGAMSVVNGKAVCDTTKCVLCGYCSKVCPAWAIKVI
jgi:predicted aldo/keto reductase-like oxidoreductase